MKTYIPIIRQCSHCNTITASAPFHGVHYCLPCLLGLAPEHGDAIDLQLEKDEHPFGVGKMLDAGKLLTDLNRIDFASLKNSSIKVCEQVQQLRNVYEAEGDVPKHGRPTISEEAVNNHQRGSIARGKHKLFTELFPSPIQCRYCGVPLTAATMSVDSVIPVALKHRKIALKLPFHAAMNACHLAAPSCNTCNWIKGTEEGSGSSLLLHTMQGIYRVTHAPFLGSPAPRARGFAAHLRNGYDGGRSKEKPEQTTALLAPILAHLAFRVIGVCRCATTQRYAFYIPAERTLALYCLYCAPSGEQASKSGLEHVLTLTATQKPQQQREQRVRAEAWRKAILKNRYRTSVLLQTDLPL